MERERLQNRRCCFCGMYFGTFSWRARLSEHLYLEHRPLIMGEVRDFTEESFEAMDLRATQRSLLLFALDNPRFSVTVGLDSSSLWHMRKRGWFTESGGEVLRERVWGLTPLGLAVARAALSRARKLGERNRCPIRTMGSIMGGVAVFAAA